MFSPTPPSPSSENCKFRHALLRGLRPNSETQKVQCGVCTDRCIYCDIWKLATLIYTHLPASLKSKSHSRSSSSSSVGSPHLSRSSSSSSTSSSSSKNEFEVSAKTIEASFQAQRARLASILSICTVEGAEESEGLRMAHDRCLSSVTHLVYQQQALRERAMMVTPRPAYALLVEVVQSPKQEPAQVSRRISRSCASGDMRERYMRENSGGSSLGTAR